MLEQAQLSIESLQHSGLNVSLLTLFDTQNLMNSEALDFISRHNLVIVIENYLPGNLLYKMITDAVTKNGVLNKSVYRLGLNSLPICGQNSEVLEFHGLNAETITEFVSLKLAKTLEIIEQPILDHFVRMSDSKSVKKIIRPFVFSQRNIVE